MAKISEHIANTIESWSEQWKDRLRGWMASWVENGLTRLFDFFEPDLRDELRESLGRIRDIPGLPADQKKIIDNALEAPGAIQFAALLPFLVGILIGFGMGTARPAMNVGSYIVDKLVKSYRLDPQSIINLWRRDKSEYESYFEDLRDQGWSEERINALRELAKIIPPLPDMVRFADFSAFDPEVIEKWRQFYDAPSWITEPLSLIGITNEAPRDWANKYWFSHFVQPGRYELGEIYRRGLLGETHLGQDEVGGSYTEGEAESLIKLAYKTMGYSSFWQDNLLQLVREVPTRVDVRRWWDMRTIDEAELRELYQRQGYFGKDLENYVLWTKVYVAFPDLLARFSNGWITEEQVRNELISLGMPADRVETMIQTKIKPSEPGRVDDGKSLTKTEVYKGVKKGLITWQEGVELLVDLGYDEAEADYILAINVGVLEGSPETFAEFKEITQKYRKATGREAKEMPEELKKAAAQVVDLTKQVESLQQSIEEEKRGIIDAEDVPEEVTKRLKSLQVKLHRAEAELARVKTDYDIKVAEWKQGG